MSTNSSIDLPSAQPIDAVHAKLAWMLLRGNMDGLTTLRFKNSLDVLDLFFGLDPFNRPVKK